MEEGNYLLGKDSVNLASAIRNMLHSSCIIDYGIVLDEEATDGIVTVQLSVAKTSQDRVIIPCVLANIAGTSFTVDVKPNKGDKVLVVYPRFYDATMFTVPEDEEKITDPVIKENASGYNLFSGIAILINQNKEATYKNVLKLADGTVDLKLAWDKDNEENLFTLNVNADGSCSLKSAKVNASINAEGTIALSNENASVSVSNDGAIAIVGKGNGDTTISIGTDGKVTVKNATTDLMQVLLTLTDVLKKFQTEGSPSKQATSPDTALLIKDLEDNQIKVLLDGEEPETEEPETNEGE